LNQKGKGKINAKVGPGRLVAGEEQWKKKYLKEEDLECGGNGRRKNKKMGNGRAQTFRGGKKR